MKIALGFNDVLAWQTNVYINVLQLWLRMSMPQQMREREREEGEEANSLLHTRLLNEKVVLEKEKEIQSFNISEGGKREDNPIF